MHAMQGLYKESIAAVSRLMCAVKSQEDVQRISAKLASIVSATQDAEADVARATRMLTDLDSMSTVVFSKEYKQELQAQHKMAETNAEKLKQEAHELKSQMQKYADLEKTVMEQFFADAKAVCDDGVQV